jgi:chromate reductase
MQMPEAYIGNIEQVRRERRALLDKSTREFLQDFMTAYADWVERNAIPS